MPRSWSVNAPQVIHQTIGSETIIIDLSRGVYFSLAGTGSTIWQEIAKGRTLDDVADGFETDTGRRASVVESITALAGELEDEQLIVPKSQRRDDDTSPESGQLGQFEAPKLIKYTDLADLLLLDPIHDVSEAGWPHDPATLDRTASAQP